MSNKKSTTADARKVPANKQSNAQLTQDSDFAHRPSLLTFSKMQGAGNDFVVIDATVSQSFLTYLAKSIITAEDGSEKSFLIQSLCDRNYGIGADQLLLIELSTVEGCDFKYRIFNQDGSEVEHCGNGARCFARYVFDHSLTNKTIINVEVMKGVIELSFSADFKQINVVMTPPCFETEQLPMVEDGRKYKKSKHNPENIETAENKEFEKITIKKIDRSDDLYQSYLLSAFIKLLEHTNEVGTETKTQDVIPVIPVIPRIIPRKNLRYLQEFANQEKDVQDALNMLHFGRFYQLKHHELGIIEFSIVSMGNPHLLIDYAKYKEDNPKLAHKINHNFWDFNLEPMAQYLQQHPAFPQGVNVGFMYALNEHEALLRVYERGSGETLACGTGACAAAVLGIMAGHFDPQKNILMHCDGGDLEIIWPLIQNCKPKPAHPYEVKIAPLVMRGDANYCFKGVVDLEQYF